MKIVILDAHTTNPGDLSWDGLSALGELTVYDRTPRETAEIVRRIGDAPYIFTNKTPITAEVIKACPNVAFVGVLSTGYNVVDTEAAKAAGIAVANIPGYSTEAVVQMVFAHLLAICHHVSEHSRAVHDGDWVTCPDFAFWNYPLVELAGKTMGIIGLGTIGIKVANVARALGMEVIAYSRSRREEGAGVAEYVTLDDLFARSDVVSLHCPLTPQTEGLINSDAIAKMKRGVILINTSRGPVVVEQDLRDALDSGQVAYAGVDVVSAEPMQQGHPLLGAENCYITPHIAWAPKETRARLIRIATENLAAFQRGKPINVVNV